MACTAGVTPDRSRWGAGDLGALPLPSVLMEAASYITAACISLLPCWAVAGAASCIGPHVHWFDAQAAHALHPNAVQNMPSAALICSASLCATRATGVCNHNIGNPPTAMQLLCSAVVGGGVSVPDAGIGLSPNHHRMALAITAASCHTASAHCTACSSAIAH